MEEFKVPIKEKYEEKYEFYKKLQEHFSKYYKFPYYSDAYYIVNGVLYQGFQGNICYLENKRKTFLMLEELYDDYILIRVISNSKRTLTVLKKFLKFLKNF